MLLAIKRAEIFSPNSIDKDNAIFREVAERLEKRGFDVRTTSESQPLPLDADATVVVSMGRHRATLDYLEEKENTGARVVNSPKAVALCCHRREMRGVLESAGVPLAPLEGDHGYWVKRADGAATTPDDVSYVATRQQALDREQWLRRERGAKDVETTAHVEGDVVKFYAVRHTGFFRCYYSGDGATSKFGDERVNGAPHHYIYNKVELQAIADRAAQAVGIEVYGGDAIVRPDGSIAIVDFNDWPSFSRCREEAAEAITKLIIKEASPQPSPKERGLNDL